MELTLVVDLGFCDYEPYLFYEGFFVDSLEFFVQPLMVSESKTVFFLSNLYAFFLSFLH